MPAGLSCPLGFLPPGSTTIRFPSLNLAQINIPTRNKWCTSDDRENRTHRMSSGLKLCFLWPLKALRKASPRWKFQRIKGGWKHQMFSFALSFLYNQPVGWVELKVGKTGKIITFWSQKSRKAVDSHSHGPQHHLLSFTHVARGNFKENLITVIQTF